MGPAILDEDESQGLPVKGDLLLTGARVTPRADRDRQQQQQRGAQWRQMECRATPGCLDMTTLEENVISGSADWNLDMIAFAGVEEEEEREAKPKDKDKEELSAQIRGQIDSAQLARNVGRNNAKMTRVAKKSGSSKSAQRQKKLRSRSSERRTCIGRPPPLLFLPYSPPPSYLNYSRIDAKVDYSNHHKIECNNNNMVDFNNNLDLNDGNNSNDSKSSMSLTLSLPLTPKSPSSQVRIFNPLKLEPHSPSPTTAEVRIIKVREQSHSNEQETEKAVEEIIPKKPKELERQRRLKMRKAFRELFSLVPMPKKNRDLHVKVKGPVFDGVKMDRLQLLREAACYCECLRNMEYRLAIEGQRLKAKKARLERHLQALIEEF